MVCCVAFACCFVMVLSSMKIVGLTARAKYEMQPTICCMHLMPAGVNIGVSSCGSDSCAASHMILGLCIMVHPAAFWEFCVEIFVKLL